MKILLGVTGSISAYKAAEIGNILTKDGNEVNVILTDGGSRFITPLTLQTLTKTQVHMDPFEEDDPTSVKHIDLAQKSDIILIAPATANIIGKIASGIADDLLSATVLAAYGQTPVYIAPAMNTYMYENPIVQGNIDKLMSLGYNFIEPKEDHLACGTSGKGALADVETIVDTIRVAGGVALG